MRQRAPGSFFDHLLAVVPEFDLRVFQSPTGRDVERALSAVADRGAEGTRSAGNRRALASQNKSPRSLPIEIYVFSSDQDWSRYEAIQADSSTPRIGESTEMECDVATARTSNLGRRPQHSRETDRHAPRL